MRAALRDSEILFPAGTALAILAALLLDHLIYGHGLRVLGFPAGLGLVTAGLCLFRLWQRHRERRQADAAPALQPMEPTLALPLVPVLKAMLGLAASVPLVWLFGFVIGLPLYVAVYVKWRGSGWVTALICAGLALAAAVGFIELLNMPQPHGPLVWP